MAILSLLFLSLTAYCADSAPKAQSGMDAYSALQSGNARFAEGHSLHPNQDPARREVVATAQHPLAIVISCSDSRVPPETVFDQGLGDLFTVRLAGNVMGPEAIASVEYAVEHLGAHLLIVLGHDSCGAVAAAVQAKTGASNGSPSLDILVKEIRSGLTAPAIQQAADDKTMSL
ncbi:MAG: carbonic anhydrase, partial [Bdellovibrionota bacterium]